MRILNATLRGFIGIKKGMGLDEITVDLADLSGLVALAGPNGHGKTTLLENLSPYRGLASRSGSIQHHVFLRDSSREINFLYDGDRFRSLVKIDSDNGRSEGFVWRNGQPQVNGKVKSYDAYINELLGSKALFYNSVFCAQNSEKLSDLTTGEFKNLMVEFLRLDRLTRHENTSKSAWGILHGIQQQQEQDAEAARKKLASFTEIERDLLLARDSQETQEVQRRDCLDKIKIVHDEIEQLKATIAQNDANTERLADIEKNIAAVYVDISQDNDATNVELSGIRDGLRGVLNQIKECEAVLQDKEKILGAAEAAEKTTREIKGAENKLQQLSEEIAQVKEAVSTFEREDLIIRGNIQKLENNPELQGMNRKLEEVVNAIRLRNDDLRALDSDRQLSALDITIKACRDKMSDLEKRPSTCSDDGCDFVISAIRARDEELPGLLSAKEDREKVITRERVEIQQRLDQLLREKDEAEAAIQARTTANNQKILMFRSSANNSAKAAAAKKEEALVLSGAQIELQERLLNLNENLGDVRQLAAKRPEIELAEARIADLEPRRGELTKKGVDIDTARKTRVAEKEKRLAELNDTKDELSLLIDPDAGRKAGEAAGRKADLERTLSTAEEAAAATLNKITLLQGKLSEQETAEADLKKITGKIARITHEKSEWDYLRNACGKNGLQALEIDGVAPLITNYANELLSQSFGPNFSVKLVTQDEETGKEVLDIVVIRGDGSESLLENLSGGEKVWILKALRLAMTMVSKEKSGRNFTSFFADEEDGALDGEKALNFVGLYRSLMETGGFDSCYYISHNPGVVAMADHQLVFSKGGITIES